MCREFEIERELNLKYGQTIGFIANVLNQNYLAPMGKLAALATLAKQGRITTGTGDIDRVLIDGRSVSLDDIENYALPPQYSAWTYDQLMAEIEATRDQTIGIVNDDCLGDMLSFMDRVHYKYVLPEDEIAGNAAIRIHFRQAVIAELNKLFDHACLQLKKELYTYERPRN